MINHSYPGISSFAKVRTHKSRTFPETKSISRNKKSKTADSIDQIASFLNSKGWKATPARSSRRRLFADLLTTIADTPVEICLGLQRLSKAHLSYGRSIIAAGGIFLVVSSAREFEDWYYNSNFKF